MKKLNKKKLLLSVVVVPILVACFVLLTTLPMALFVGPEFSEGAFCGGCCVGLFFCVPWLYMEGIYDEERKEV